MKVSLMFLYVLFCFPSNSQTLNQAMMALRSNEHSKVEIIDSAVVFYDQIDSLKNVPNFDYLALELAESLYKQMSEPVYNPYFNAIFRDGFLYKNHIESSDQTVINITASPDGIIVKIINDHTGESADELFEF